MAANRDRLKTDIFECIREYNGVNNLNTHIGTYIGSMVTKYTVIFTKADGKVVRTEAPTRDVAEKRAVWYPVGSNFQGSIVTEVKIEPSKPHIFTNDVGIKYFSSYLQSEAESFCTKNFIWMSSQLDQALLHIFHYLQTRKDIERLDEITDFQPVIYRFNLKEINLINSPNKENKNIFKGLLPDELIGRLDDVLKRNGIKEGMNSFTKQENKYILIILEQLNKILEEANKIYGYYNYYDQNEIGLTEFYKNVISESIIESKYRTINMAGRITNFPIKLTRDNIIKIDNVQYDNEEQNFTKDATTLKFRMFLTDDYNETTIIIDDFDNLRDTYTWIKPRFNDFFKLKYLKYKQKYLQLKNKLNL